MKRLCSAGCRREARTEWIKPGEDPWWFCDWHTRVHRDALTEQGWSDFPELDDRADEAPNVTHIGGGPLDADCG